MKKSLLAALVAGIGISAHARDVKQDLVGMCGKDTVGNFAASYAVNQGIGAQGILLQPVSGLTFAGVPVQTILASAHDSIYGVTIAGTPQSAKKLIGANSTVHVNALKTPGMVAIFCPAA
jgi:sugar/nucleoside kinase (ribokinase family)